MSPNDSNSDLDSRIAAIVESTVGRMRDELMHRMQDTESRLREITGRMGDAVAAAAAEPAAEPPVEAPAAEAAPAAADAAPELFDVVAAMDRGTSQQEVLAALLEGIGGFASRSALFLTRSDGAQGWGSYGFEETAGDMQQVSLSYGEGPLAALSEGSGCVVLTADECGDLCRQMGATPAAEGLLVPFVLRDRLAAALYVDRFDDDAPLARRSIQLLTYIGAQAVEGLALRQRAETPTLLIATEEAAAPGVALWEAPAAPAEAEPPATEPPAAPPAAEPEPAAAEPAPSEPAEPAAELPAEITLEELPEEEEEEREAPEVEPAAMATPPTEVEAVADEEWEMPAVSLDQPVEEPEPPAPALAEEPAEPPESPTEPTLEGPEDQPWTSTGGAGFSSAEVAAEPPPIPAAPPAASDGETTEVRPPTDVSGPGWAFTASRAAAEAGDEAQHEEARRLARLLVTEIKLYNEEQVEEGRRSNDIYPRLREDIDRSRQIFNERVDEAVRQETDYFHEEMVRILAGGNAEALGL